MLIILLYIFLLLIFAQADSSFPEEFSFGVSSAAYQVEGGWNADGKGENIWDHLLHNNPNFSYQQANGDIAADTYNHGVKDVPLLTALGLQHYRFSISWSRILPTGKNDNINEKGVAYYNSLIDGLVAANITPIVTLYHWDLPQPLQDDGGFLNRTLIQHYQDYARLCFQRFGDRVKNWITFNEPISTCKSGYEDGDKAPALQFKGTGAYECAHVVLLSHGHTYRLYENEFKAEQNGRVSITIDTSWFGPKNSSSEADQTAANRNLIWNYEWWMAPVVDGDYPDLIKTVVAANSKEENLAKSRLPEFTDAEKKVMKGSLDFVALNFYTAYLCTPGGAWGTVQSSWWRDVMVDCAQPDSWEPGSGWLRYTPWAFPELLKYIKNRFNNPEIFITENGFSGADTLKDDDRTKFIRGYLEYLLKAITEDKINVTGYTYWSFLDDFEWTAGYLAKFGIYQVDFNDPDRTRTRRYSSYVYENIVKTRKVDWNYTPEWPPK